MKLFDKEKETNQFDTQHVEDYIIETEQAENIQAAKGHSSFKGIFENPYVYVQS